MDRRAFIKGALAAGMVAMAPSTRFPGSIDVAPSNPSPGLLNPVWIAEGDGWRQVSSLLDVKKGDIFVITWPMRCKAMGDGMIDPTDGQECVPAVSFAIGGPSAYPPYPCCNRCKDRRVVPPEERTDVDEERRKVCDLCIADPGRAERKSEAYRQYLKLHPPARLG